MSYGDDAPNGRVYYHRGRAQDPVVMDLPGDWFRPGDNPTEGPLECSQADTLPLPLGGVVFAGGATVTSRRITALRSDTSELDLRALAHDPDMGVRVKVAGNRHTPAGELQVLAGDAVERVRLAVAANPNTPVEVLERLRGDGSRVVRAEARRGLRLARR